MRFTHAIAASHYQLVIVGGGTAGCALTHLCKKFVGKGHLAVIEKKLEHHYQPGYTLVGCGLRPLNSFVARTEDVLHKDAVWLKNYVAQFNPRNSSLILDDGSEVKYDFLAVATGLQLRYDMIKGFPEGLETDSIASIYSADYVEKTFKILSAFKGGNAVFTYPNTPIKCAGAPQKICYLAEEIFRKNGVREKTNVIYNTSLASIFGVKKYADALWKVVRDRNITVNTRENLIEVHTGKREAYFETLDDHGNPTGVVESIKYDLLHVAPPCSPIKVLRECSELTDDKGWLDVNPLTLLSRRYDNIFGAGDCMNTPNAKTAAAVASQLRSLKVNMKAAINGKPLTGEYDGYASCPLMISSKRVILAEFTPSGPLETMPFDQAKPSYFACIMKRVFLPLLYWHFLIKGMWLGPAVVRKILHLGFTKD